MKTLKRTVKLEGDFLNEWNYRVLREVEEHQRKIVNEMIEVILSEGLSLIHISEPTRPY